MRNRQASPVAEAVVSVAVAPAIVIKPSGGFITPRIAELWGYRELFAFLVWRDLKVRYAQTVLGAAWSVFQPLALMGVYTYAFTELARINTAPIPYALYALSGLTLWIFVSRAVFQGTMSLVAEIALVTKTAAPRMLIPLAAVVSMLVDFVISLGLFLVFDFAYGRLPSWRFVFVFPIVAMSFLMVYGVCLFLSALNVRYRDVGQALPFVLQLWFFTTPVAFPLLTPGGHAWETALQALNPMVGLTLAIRWALLGTPAPHGLLYAAITISLACLLVGLVYFSRAERTIADDV